MPNGDYKPPYAPYAGPCARSSGRGNKPILRIVLHGTVSAAKEGGARNIAAYFRSGAAGGSAHYVIDPGVILQTAYDSIVCWHAPPNPHSIGIEFCDPVAAPSGKPAPKSRWFDTDHAPMMRLGARLVAELCLAYNVPPRMVGPGGLRAGRKGICEHSDVSQAWKQSTHWDLGEFPRVTFARLVRREVQAIRDGSPTGKPITLDTVVAKLPRRPAVRDQVEQPLRTARAKLRAGSLQRAEDTRVAQGRGQT